MIDIPMPPSWSESKPTCASEEELKQMVLNGEVPTAIADSGASSSVGKPMISTCGDYALNADPLVHTGRKSTKIFQYGGGSVAPASEVKEFPFDVRGEAKDIHMVPGTQNNLMSTNTFTNENYVKVFDNEEVNIYDANDIEIKTTRGAILRGWKVPEEGLWRFPLVKDAAKICNLNTETAILNIHPHEVLQDLPPQIKLTMCTN